MATKYVQDTSAGKAISAWVILDKRGRYVATVRSYYGPGGSCLVNVFQSGDAYKRCAKAAKLKGDDHEAYDRFGFQYARAGGYGYDKFAAALGGLMIDGHKMTDHCGASLPKPKGADRFPEGFKPPKGYHLANWIREGGGYDDCYRSTGLRFLEEIGYHVHQAI